MSSKAVSQRIQAATPSASRGIGWRRTARAAPILKAALHTSPAYAALHIRDAIGYDPFMNREMRSKPKPPKFSGPPRVRHEPPTIDEAISAAQDLAGDVEQQVAIVAGLMSIPEDQARSQVLSAPPRRAVPRSNRDWAPPTRSPQVVVVRRRRFGPE